MFDSDVVAMAEIGSPWNSVPDGKARITFDIPEAVDKRMRAVIRQQGFKSMSSFLNAVLVVALQKFERQPKEK